MASLEQLYELQELDWEIAELEKALDDVRAKLSDNSAITAVRRRTEQLDAQVESRSSVRREYQFSADQIQGKLTNVDNTLYGGSVTNPRELSAYEDEKAMLERQLGEEEDRLLELMVEVEELQSERNNYKGRLDRLEAQWAVQSTELSKEQERLEIELRGGREARQGLTPGISPPVLALYESLLKIRDGYAIAKVDRNRGLCEACRVRLPAGELQQVRSSDGTVQCNNCRRILYMG